MAITHRTAEQWQKIFKHFNESNMTVALFCEQQQLTKSNFYTWRNRLQISTVKNTKKTTIAIEPNTAQDWVSVTPEQCAPTQTISIWDIELSLPNGVVLRMMNS